MILIIGSKGTLGSEFMRQLGDKAIGWDFDEIDITKESEMQKIINLRPSLIINCAAYNAVDKAEEEQEMAMQINGHAVGLLSKTAKQLNIPIVHYSTDFVFDGTSNKGYKEDDTPNPQSVYAHSKYLGEQLLQKENDKFYIIRLTGLFGESGGGKKSFPEARIEDSKIRNEFTIVCDEFTSPTYAPDLVKRTLYIINNSLPFGIYHGNNSGVCSWYKYTCQIFEIAGIKTKVIPVFGDELKRSAKRPSRAVLLNTKLPPARYYEEALNEFLQKHGFINHNS
ncbi:MAG: dTDP-4-dehydrorhamnose reductase [Patescibacteria group bacterium]|nr:dTDP-4-dehydrorhamnose reductase [Patescibacteria group bacterium]